MGAVSSGRGDYRTRGPGEALTDVAGMERWFGVFVAAVLLAHAPVLAAPRADCLRFGPGHVIALGLPVTGFNVQRVNANQ